MKDATKTPASQRRLRLITVLLWFPTFAMLLAHGISAHEVLPALCIIPMTVSMVVSLIAMTGRYSKCLVAVIDVFAATSLIATLIPTWVAMQYMADRRYYGSRFLILATYATVPVIFNYAIHLYFVLNAYYREALQALATSRTCQHCRSHIDTNNNRLYSALGERAMEESAHPVDSKDAQHAPSFRDVEEGASTEPRPSTEDETARLL